MVRWTALEFAIDTGGIGDRRHTGRGGWDRQPFTGDGNAHVSVYRPRQPNS